MLKVWLYGYASVYEPSGGNTNAQTLHVHLCIPFIVAKEDNIKHLWRCSGWAIRHSELICMWPYSVKSVHIILQTLLQKPQKGSVSLWLKRCMQMTLNVKCIIQVIYRETHKLGLNAKVFMIVWLCLESMTEFISHMFISTSLISSCTIVLW